MTFAIDHLNQLIVLSATGVLRASEVIDCTRSLNRDGDWCESYKTLVDMTTVDRMDIGFSEMRSIAATSEMAARTRMRTGRHALVARGDANFGMARMYEAMVDGKLSRQIKTFRKIEDARKWLNEPPRRPLQASASGRSLTAPDQIRKRASPF
ncbi:MAG: hypothetical protein ISR47_09365 [Rhodospirillales bacterium]|nr:hypothetical protein [Rhodospirillales bacterium]